MNPEEKKVVFETESWQALKYYRETATPKVIQWTMKYSGHLVKDQKQASYVLVGLAVLAIIVSLFLFFGFSGQGGGAFQEKIERLMLETPILK